MTGVGQKYDTKFEGCREFKAWVLPETPNPLQVDS